MTEALSTSTKKLLAEFSWFDSAFNNALQSASDDFLLGGLHFKLVSVSQNMNTLFQDDSYFVTKIKVDAKNEVYIRSSDKAVRVILERSLGPSKKAFQINQITELEAKLITAYNDNLYNFISSNFIPQQYDGTVKKFDTVHLTFMIKDNESGRCGKVIVSFPNTLILPQEIQLGEQKFSNDSFLGSLVEVNISVGTTSFTVKDLKSLEVEDIVVLDNSNIQLMNLRYMGYSKDFRIAPNPALIISVDNGGEEEMASNMPPANLWDSIQVEMGAEFDKVKISLGELKNIEDGLVVDIGSVYNNNITLKVEEKTIATGELVIVNDRYGVKINHIFADAPSAPAPQPMPEMQQEMPIPDSDVEMHQDEMAGEPMQEMGDMPEDGQGDEDFDYSDFELDDEDI